MKRLKRKLAQLEWLVELVSADRFQIGKDIIYQILQDLIEIRDEVDWQIPKNAQCPSDQVVRYLNIEYYQIEIAHSYSSLFPCSIYFRRRRHPSFYKIMIMDKTVPQKLLLSDRELNSDEFIRLCQLMRGESCKDS